MWVWVCIGVGVYRCGFACVEGGVRGRGAVEGCVFCCDCFVVVVFCCFLFYPVCLFIIININAFDSALLFFLHVVYNLIEPLVVG